MEQHFSSTILQWFSKHGRHLPWRETTDPYAIWLSEIILQQTRVEQGRAYWERFIKEYPTVWLLAEASEDDVLRLWQGLGYYSRARNLHHAARRICEQGAFPVTYAEIRKLKGVGDYTAAAIASLAFNLPYAVVDGNVYRVLARYFGMDVPIDNTEGKKFFAALAQELLPTNRAADYNQGIMDFGALCCVPQHPQCGSCPLADSCVAYRENLTHQLPVKSKTLKIRQRKFTYVYLSVRGYTAFRRRSAGDIWQGLWEPFMTENGSLPNFNGTWTMLASGVKHVLTHQTIIADFYLLETNRRPELPSGYKWIKEKAVCDIAISRLVERLLEYLPVEK